MEPLAGEDGLVAGFGSLLGSGFGVMLGIELLFGFGKVLLSHPQSKNLRNYLRQLCRVLGLELACRARMTRTPAMPSRSASRPYNLGLPEPSGILLAAL